MSLKIYSLKLGRHPLDTVEYASLIKETKTAIIAASQSLKKAILHHKPSSPVFTIDEFILPHCNIQASSPESFEKLLLHQALTTTKHQIPLHLCHDEKLLNRLYRLFIQLQQQQVKKAPLNYGLELVLNKFHHFHQYRLLNHLFLIYIFLILFLHF